MIITAQRAIVEAEPNGRVTAGASAAASSTAAANGATSSSQGAGTGTANASLGGSAHATKTPATPAGYAQR